jgi:hypothetical protein
VTGLTHTGIMQQFLTFIPVCEKFYGSVTLLLVSLVLASCGILGLYKDEISYDPAFRAKVIKEINDNAIGKQMDSLIARIDAAPSVFPADMENRTLIFETFNYEGFLQVQSHKLHTHVDTKRRRKSFSQYEMARKSGTLIQDPRIKIVYIDKGEYENLDKEEYRYVLKTTNRLLYDENELVVQNDGTVYPWVSNVLYYIYDRQTDAVFAEIKDLKQLGKKRR